MIVNADDFVRFLKTCQKSKTLGYEQVIVPVVSANPKNKELVFSPVDTERTIELDTTRTIDPLKNLFYVPREKIYPTDFKNSKRIIAGVKACDLKALSILDKALLLDNFVDPSFEHWRNNTLIISTDCTEPSPACHCTLMDGSPYPNAGFDINLSRVLGNYHISIGTEKGKQFVEHMAMEVEIVDAIPDVKDQVEANRNKMERLIDQLNQDFVRTTDYEEIQHDSINVWQQRSKACVGCGACTNICPTCYCLILNDESKAEQFIKVRSQDSCQLNGYARVAGGGTPRPQMFSRFRNRYLCKLLFMKSNFGEIGCTGCGRCTEACPAQIDYREVVENIGHEREFEKIVQDKSEGDEL